MIYPLSLNGISYFKNDSLARRTNNERENKSRTDYQYKVGDKVLINRDVIQRKLLPKRDGPYEVVRIYDNGTIKLRKGIVVQRINIRRLQPYHLL
jgi:hypothetical protein